MNGRRTKSFVYYLVRERMIIRRRLDIIHAVVPHLFILFIVQKTNLRFSRQQRTRDEIRPRFVVARAPFFHHGISNLESTNGFFKEGRFAFGYFPIQIHHNVFYPLDIFALVVGVQIYAMTSPFFPLFVNVF